MVTDLVPRAVLSPPENARKRVSVVVGAATGAAALAGLWFRFDDGLAIRLALAATSAIFGWLTMEVALSAKSPAAAAGRAWGIAIVLGALSTIAPSIIMAAREQASLLAIYIPFGAIFGAIVGFAYGIVLAIVAATTFTRIASGTHDGADRAVRISAMWALLPLAVIAVVVFGHDARVVPSEWSSDRERAARELGVPLGILALGVLSQVALGSYWLATRRLGLRRRWIELVTSGIDPRWAVREVREHDDVGSVPRLRQNGMVLEWKNEHAVYRASAAGEAVAII